MPFLYNQPEQTTRRRDLRKTQTPAEAMLWFALRRQKLGLRFRRQFGMGRFIVDFYCPRARLIIEVDGESHFTEYGRRYDLMRDAFLRSLGMRILRFTNEEVQVDRDAVIKKIQLLLPHPPYRILFTDFTSSP